MSQTTNVELVEPTEENGWNPYAKYQCCGCEEYGHPPTHVKCKKYLEATNRAKAAQQARNTRSTGSDDEFMGKNDSE